MAGHSLVPGALRRGPDRLRGGHGVPGKRVHDGSVGGVGTGAGAPVVGRPSRAASGGAMSCTAVSCGHSGVRCGFVVAECVCACARVHVELLEFL